MQVCSRVAGGRSSTMTVPVVFGPLVAPPTTAPAPAPTTAPIGPPTIAPATAPVVAPVAAPASVALAARPMMLERMVSLLAKIASCRHGNASAATRFRLRARQEARREARQEQP